MNKKDRHVFTLVCTIELNQWAKIVPFGEFCALKIFLFTFKKPKKQQLSKHKGKTGDYKKNFPEIWAPSVQNFQPKEKKC